MEGDLSTTPAQPTIHLVACRREYLSNFNLELSHIENIILVRPRSELVRSLFDNLATYLILIHETDGWNLIFCPLGTNMRR